MKRIQRATRHAWQRLNRGWDDSATWNLDRYLTATLGAQLNHLADTTHGWPNQTHETPEAWEAALRTNGAKLAYYGHLDFASTPEQWEAAYAGAQEALTWVAANLRDLWD
jgi:hypothetical protein